MAPNVPYPVGWPGGPPPPVGPPKSMWIAVVAVVLGLLGCVLPLAPFDLTGVRPYIALPFALPGFVAGVIGLTGRRRGKPLAFVGLVLCMIGLGLAAVMIFNTLRLSFT